MNLIDFILHIDQYLNSFIIEYSYWVYGLLFLIVFVETGLVVMPFLPGDSLLFAVGMFAAQGSLSLWIAISVLLLATFLGDNSNYFIGRFLGEKMLQLRIKGKALIQPKHIEQTHNFFEKHGPKTIIIARFVPIVRTLTPFVSGVGKMTYSKFISFSILGALLWVVGLCVLGYSLGNIPLVKDNFEKVILIITILSVMPMIVQLIKTKMKK